jgi:transposase
MGAVPRMADLGALSRVENPRPLTSYLGLTPRAYSSGERRRQGRMTKAGYTFARRALIEGARASRYPAQVSRHLQWASAREVLMTRSTLPPSTGHP